MEKYVQNIYEYIFFQNICQLTHAVEGSPHKIIYAGDSRDLLHLYFSVVHWSMLQQQTSPTNNTHPFCFIYFRCRQVMSDCCKASAYYRPQIAVLYINT